MLTAIVLVGAMTAATPKSAVAGQHCLDSNLSILTSFPTRMRTPTNLQTPSPANVIVRIDKVAANKRDFPTVVPVVGFIYTLGSGEQYYAPRSQTVLSKGDMEASKAFMLAAGARRSATPQALQWALNSYGTASVRIYPTSTAFRKANVRRESCLAWPNGKPLPF